MAMNITIPDEIAQAAEALARDTGSSAERVLVEALKAHFPPIPPELQAEFDAWERASDQDGALVGEREGRA